jgi:hypothetical protein
MVVMAHAGPGALPGGNRPSNATRGAGLATALAASALVATAQPVGAPLREVAGAVGLDFRHFNGMTGELYLPEIMGPGAAFLDYDGDGDLDVYLVQGTLLGPGKSMGDARSAAPPDGLLSGRLFRNDLAPGPGGEPRLRFTDATRQSRIAALVGGYGMGVATGDFDRDGRPDLYLTHYGHSQLLRNRGDGTFEDVTGRAGVGNPGWGVSAAFADLDRDGWLDLYVGNYLEVRLEGHRPCHNPSSTPDYCHPLSYSAQPDRLYRNRGDGTFEDVSVRSGVAAETGPALGVLPGDFNGDGWTDLYVANDSTPNLLWVNQRDGTLRNDAVMAGAAVDMGGAAQASMGVSAGDVDRDGDEDIVVTNLTGEGLTLYANDGQGWFEDRTIVTGLSGPSQPFTGFGTGWLDLDADGWLDLFVANGAVTLIRALAEAGDPFPLHQRNQLFRNREGRGFAELAPPPGGPMALSEVSRGVAFGDVDNDGDTDVLVANNNGPARLLLNDAPGHARWLGLRAVDRDASDALGARVRVVRADGSVLERTVRTAGSYASASDPRALFGLGGDRAVRAVEVLWPDGRRERWQDVPLGRYSTLARGSGTPQDEASP